MKPLTCTLLFSFFAIISFSQDYTILRLFAEDATGRIDSITIGRNDTATLGVDVGFNENNIYGVPYDSLDMRIIQRDSINHNCIRVTHFTGSPYPNLYFPENIDTKIDFRPTGTLWSAENNFEIFVHAEAYPVIIRADISELFWMNASTVQLLDSMCNSIGDYHLDDDLLLSDTLLIIPNASFNTLILRFDVLINTQNIISTIPAWKLHPNPASDFVTISELGFINGRLEIFNSIGQIVQSEILIEQDRLELSIQNLSKGLYFVKVFDEEAKVFTTRKLIKH